MELIIKAAQYRKSVIISSLREVEEQIASFAGEHGLTKEACIDFTITGDAHVGFKVSNMNELFHYLDRRNYKNE